MTWRWLLAAVHLLGLGIGLGAIFARGGALRDITIPGAVQRALLADRYWDLAALLWIPTGLLRAFGGFEKGTEYYLGSNIFWIKMGLLLVILVLEVVAKITITRWRRRLPTGDQTDRSRARTVALASYVQLAAVVAMVLAATAMARGLDV